LICEAQTYALARISVGSNPIASLIGLIIFAYILYRIIKWFASKNKNEKDAEQKRGAVVLIGKVVLLMLVYYFISALHFSGVDGKITGVMLLVSFYLSWKLFK
jgi:uncharacterized membrane protein